MKAILFEHAGKPADILKSVEKDLPQPGIGEVRIKVGASPINPSDVMFVQNLYGIRPQFPSAAGFEGMGTIDAVGEGVTMPIGQRVSFTGLGTWAEYAIAHQKSVIPVPNEMPDEVAAQLFVNPFTVVAMIEESGVKPTLDNADGPHEWLMLTACGSAFGKMAIQLCKQRGIRTIGTVRRNDLADELKALGLTEIINTETEDMAARVKEITSGQGVNCVLDAVGGHTATEAINCLGKGGTMLIYGLMSMQDPTLNSGLMIFRQLTIRGFWLTDWMRHVDPKIRQRVAGEVITLLSSGQIKLPVEATYGLDDIAKAVEHADAPGRWGKILLKP